MSKTIKSSDLITKLKDAFKSLKDEVASAKTEKYVTSRPDFDERLNSVVDTIVGLMSCYGSVVTVKGIDFMITDYNVPAKLEDLINCGRIFAAVDSIGRVNPIFKVEKVDVSLTPESFNRFFSDFNSNQSDDTKVKLSEGITRRTISLEDVQYLKDKSGAMVKLHENGFDIELCYLLGLEIDGISEYLNSYSAPNALGVALWLLR